MGTSHLRLFPADEASYDGAPATKTTAVRLKELFPLLARAHRDGNVWLRDFESDEIRVSSDLYQVIRAFSQCSTSA